MIASEKLIEVAGFVLAEALWEASQAAGAGRAFEPLGGVVQDDQFQWVQFATESEEFSDAGTQAIDYLIEHSDEYQAWAVAEDKLVVRISKSDRKKFAANEISAGDLPVSDTVVVTAWEQGLEEPLTIQQVYEPKSSGRFRILGTPQFAMGGETLSEALSSSCIEPLRSGFMNNERAARDWESWT